MGAGVDERGGTVVAIGGRVVAAVAAGVVVAGNVVVSAGEVVAVCAGGVVVSAPVVIRAAV